MAGRTGAQDRGPDAEERRARRRGFALGVMVTLALGFLACATGGSRKGGAGAASGAGGGATETVTHDPPSEATAAAPATAAAVPPPAAVAPAAAVSEATGDSPVAGYLADPQAIGRASQLFRAVCTGYCHSTQASADRVAPNLFDCGWDHGSTDQEIFRTVYDGVPDSQMQGFGERLPNEDLWKMVAYLRQRSTCK